MQILLFVELGETSPRQRTILRRNMLEQGWVLTGEDFLFSCWRNIDSDELAVAYATKQLHRALGASEIVEWGADCFVKSKTRTEKKGRLAEERL